MKAIGCLLGLLIAFQVQAQEVVKTTRKWYVNETQIGWMMGHNNLDGANRAHISVQMLNGYRVASRFVAGLTIGADWYNDILISPLALGLRYDLSKSKNVIPYLSFDGGYGTTLLNKTTDNLSYRGGLMVNPSFGLKFRLNDGSAIVLSAGYKHQRAERIIDNGEVIGWGTQRMVKEYDLNRFVVRFGVSF
ncbi:MAG: hypothetical protein U0Y10_26765 [Spirosomataceae bacterium]